MYTVYIKPKQGNEYYTFTLISPDHSHYINAYISKGLHDNILVLISKSADGFFFSDTDDEINDLQLNETMTFEETYKTIKKFLTDRGYKLPTS